MKIPRFHDAHRGSMNNTILVSHHKTRIYRNLIFRVSSGIQLTFVALAIGTCLVRIKLEQTLNNLLVLGGLIRGRTARHDSSSTRSGE